MVLIDKPLTPFTTWLEIRHKEMKSLHSGEMWVVQPLSSRKGEIEVCGIGSLAARSQAKPTRPRSDMRERAWRSGSNKLIFIDEWDRKVVVQSIVYRK